MSGLINALSGRPIESLFFAVVIAVTISLLAGQYYFLAIGPSLIILATYLLMRFPGFWFYLMIFLIPLDAFRGGSGALQFLTISKFVGIGLIVFVLGNVLVKKKADFNIESNLWPWLILFFVVNIVSALMSDFAITAFDNLRQLLVVCIFFALTLIFVDRRGFARYLPLVIIISMTINAGLSIAGSFFHIPFLAMNLKTMTRATGLSNDPNLFASMAIFSIPLVAWWMFSAKRFRTKLFAVISMLSILAAIVLSYSRSAAVVLLLVLACLLVEHGRRFKPKYLGFVTLMILIAVLGIMAVVPAEYWSHQKTVVNTADSSIGRRVSYTNVAQEIFKAHPFLGIGPGAFKEMYAQSQYAFQYAEKLEDFKRFAHNTYLEVLAGTGLLGMFFFVAILAVTMRNFKNAIKAFKLNNNNEMVSLIRAYRLSHVAIMLFFLFISSQYHKFFWLPVALSQLALRFSQASENNDRAE